MKLTFTKEETELLIELFNARIECLKSMPLGSRRVRGYEYVRDLITNNQTYNYRKPLYVKILSCTNEALLQDKYESRSMMLGLIKERIQFPCNH